MTFPTAVRDRAKHQDVPRWLTQVKGIAKHIRPTSNKKNDSAATRAVTTIAGGCLDKCICGIIHYAQTARKKASSQSLKRYITSRSWQHIRS